MPPTESRPKTLYYKRAAVVGGQPRKLQEMLKDALDAEPKPLARAQEFQAEGDTSVRLINRCYLQGAMLAGRMHDFVRGSHQAVIVLDENKTELDISQLAPREREQFLAGTLFFGVQGDHVIVIQSTGLRAGHLEQHLNWLLEKNGVLQKGARVVLNDEPGKDVRSRMNGVRSLTLRAPVTADSFHSAEQTPNDGRVTTKVLRTITGLLPLEGTFLEQLVSDEALAIEDVELSLQIRRRGRMRPGPSLLDELAHSLRNSDDVPFEMKTSAGVIRSGELKLIGTKTVATQNGMPILADVAAKMQEWLGTLFSEGQVREVV